MPKPTIDYSKLTNADLEQLQIDVQTEIEDRQAIANIPAQVENLNVRLVQARGRNKTR